MGDAKKGVLRAVREYCASCDRRLPAGKVPVSGKIFGEEEVVKAVEAVLEGWWTEGRFNAEFEGLLKGFVGAGHALTVNSGSSANLAAFFALTSARLGGKRVQRGDEVVATACTFPTTLNPVLQFGAVPVLVDVEPGTYNPSAAAIEGALSEKTKAIFIGHALGNPFEAEKIRGIADERGIWLIEDACDALGSTLNGRMAGSFGHLSTLSFYPAHQITTAEGGAVLTSDPLLNRIVRSVRAWGRDCWCRTGKDDTCKRRFGWKLGNLPLGYDHKYIYSEAGFNLKMTDIQAAIGVAQMARLDGFTRKRKQNFAYLKKRLLEEGLDSVFVMPESIAGAEPAWFGFPLAIRRESGLDRTKLLEALNAAGVATRLMFAGNVTKQPYFIENAFAHRVSGSLEVSDEVMERAFWLGVYPALEEGHLDYAVKNLSKFTGG